MASVVCPSISRARFVTDGAISLKLGVMIPFVNMPRRFLAHLTYAITWHPSSISTASFVTAGAIDLKL
jgi:hypothetical protein